MPQRALPAVLPKSFHRPFSRLGRGELNPIKFFEAPHCLLLSGETRRFSKHCHNFSTCHNSSLERFERSLAPIQWTEGTSNELGAGEANWLNSIGSRLQGRFHRNVFAF
jgi:hypothetical protein